MITPSYSLNLVSGSLDPSVTFTRSDATATATNSSGFVETVLADAPRFDYDPITLACRGLLVEEERQNIAFPSADFTVWPAATTNRTMSEGTSPDGLNNANKLAPTLGASATNSYIVKQFTKATSAIAYTASVYVKAAEYTQASLLIHGTSAANNAQATITLTNGALSTVGSAGTFTGATATAQNAGNGWWRIVLTATTNADSVISVRIYPRLAGGTGTGTDGVLAWGAQLELGAFATSHIPTTSASVVRNADVATITGTNFSNFWQATRGGVLVRARPGTVSGTRPWLQFDDGTADNIIALRGNTTNPELYIKATTDQAQIDAGTIASNTSYRLAGAWGTDSCAASINSGTPVLDGAATIPTVTQARLGSDGTNYLNGWLESIEYYDTPSTSAGLQVLSSAAGYRSMIRSMINPVL